MTVPPHNCTHCDQEWDVCADRTDNNLGRPCCDWCMLTHGGTHETTTNDAPNVQPNWTSGT
jgi:hypothetical protein